MRSWILAAVLALGALAAAAAKALWRRELAPVSWRRLALPACAACVAVTLAGLVLSGRDGKMLTYAALVVACATCQWVLVRGWKT